MMVSKYLDMDADNLESVSQYYKVRAAELGDNLLGVIEKPRGEYIAKFESGCRSLYIPESLRGKGILRTYAGEKFVTIKDCGVVEAYEHVGIDVDLREGWFDFPQYKVIKKFYGDRKAERSGEFLMWHITEGCRLLKGMGASDEAIKAYMLHPKYQNDEDYYKNIQALWEDCGRDQKVMENVLEYRQAANAYLCRPETDGWGADQIRKACGLKKGDVCDMLFADKHQNFADFKNYHLGTHPRSNELHQYFKNWIGYLCEVDCEVQD